MWKVQSSYPFLYHFLPRPWDQGIVDFSRTEDAGLGDLSTHTWWDTKSVSHVEKPHLQTFHSTVHTRSPQINDQSIQTMAIKWCEFTKCWESTALLIMNGRPLISPHVAYLPSLWWTRDHRHLLQFKEFSQIRIHKKQQMFWVNIKLSRNILSCVRTESGIVLILITCNKDFAQFLCVLNSGLSPR